MSCLTRPFPLRCVASGVALVGVAVLLAAAAQASAAPGDAIASAGYGKAEIWLQRKPSDHTQRELVFKASSDAAPRVLSVTVPQRNTHFVSAWAENLGLGLDASGTLTVVLQSKRGLYFTHVIGTPHLHHVPGTTKDDTFPSIFRGRLAYGRQIGETRSVVRLGSLTGARVRTVWHNTDGEWAAQDTAIGAGNTIALVTVRDGAGNGGYQAQIVRPGGTAKRLLNLGLGDTHDGGLAITGVSPSGRRLTINRQFDGASTDIAFALPSGRKIS
jgi:hypothetical protein